MIYSELKYTEDIIRKGNISIHTVKYTEVDLGFRVWFNNSNNECDFFIYMISNNSDNRFFEQMNRNDINTFIYEPRKEYTNLLREKILDIAKPINIKREENINKLLYD